MKINSILNPRLVSDNVIFDTDCGELILSTNAIRDILIFSSDMISGILAYEHADIKPVLDSDGRKSQFMPKINGIGFRCSCGCNVFHKPNRKIPSIYKCNACGLEYETEF